jgi:alkanesulfonate monooxygenase SsuD/methylene tetrahydromethanopterin reductase-like flavin-dependent oxidoreductase (luciferase family)
VVGGIVRRMRYGLDISPAGPWGRPDQVAELATLAEDHGWDGVFCEDYLQFPGGLATYDVWLTLGLVAQATTRLTIGTMVTPLPARHPASLALQVGSVAAVADGRLVLGVGSGDPEGDPVIVAGASRAELLESGLATVREACPDVPVWVGGAVTKLRPRARALRWDGACLYGLPPPDWVDLTPEDVAALRADAARTSFVIAVGGRERRDDLDAERRYVRSLADAGADWWHEYVPPRLDLAEARRRIVAGPVGAPMAG